MRREDGMRVSRCAIVVLALLGLLLAVTPAALAKGHLDRTFGRRGVLALQTDKANNYGGLTEMRTGPKGEIFFAEYDSCRQSDCSYRLYLRRYAPSGHLDSSFGRPLVGTFKGETSLAVDLRGRPLAALGGGHRVVVSRFLPGGQLDHSFGQGGSATLGCGCELDSIVAMPDGGALVLAVSKLSKSLGAHGRTWVVTRLRADGSLDRGFAKRGVLRRPMPNFREFSASVEPGGGVLLYALDNTFPGRPLIERLSRKGKLVPRFARNATRALRGLKGTRVDDIGWNGMALLPRRHDGTTVLGEPYEEHGSVAALLANGKRDPSFAKGGRQVLPLETTDAAPDGDGGGLIAGYFYGKHGGYKVARLRPGGGLDRGFGLVGLPGADDEEGVFIEPAGPGAAIVYDPGLSFCRSDCQPAKPKLYRVVG